MEIRRAGVEDLPRITEIYNQAVRTRLSTSDEDEKPLSERTVWFQQFDDRYPLWVMVEQHEIVAYGGLFRYNPKSGYRFVVENTVYVHEAHQGKGHGRQMLNHVIESARSLGYRYMQAKIFQHNSASIDLHRSCGFILEGIQRDIACLDGKFYDCALMALHLVSQPGPTRIFTGSPWEEKVGYCRALKTQLSSGEELVTIAGTVAMKDGNICGLGDPQAQAMRCLEIIEQALNELGGTLQHIVRTRSYVTQIQDWEKIGAAHAAYFSQRPPAATMVEVKQLINPQLLVEIEAEALIPHKKGKV